MAAKFIVELGRTLMFKKDNHFHFYNLWIYSEFFFIIIFKHILIAKSKIKSCINYLTRPTLNFDLMTFFFEQKKNLMTKNRLFQSTIFFKKKIKKNVALGHKPVLNRKLYPKQKITQTYLNVKEKKITTPSYYHYHKSSFKITLIFLFKFSQFNYWNTIFFLFNPNNFPFSNYENFVEKIQKVFHFFQSTILLWPRKIK